MGERLDRALKMPLPEIGRARCATWRRMGGSKLTILGGEPTLHPDYCETIRLAGSSGYEHVITTTNAQEPALRKFRQLQPGDFAYVQVSLDGGSAATHDRVRGAGTFDAALRNCGRAGEARVRYPDHLHGQPGQRRRQLRLLDIADELGVSLVKFHVFSAIGSGHGAAELAMQPQEWIDFYDQLNG